MIKIVPFLARGILCLFLAICMINMMAAKVTTAHKVKATVKITKSSSVGVLLEMIVSDAVGFSVVGTVRMELGVGGTTINVIKISHTIIRI